MTEKEIRKFEKRKAKEERYQKYLELTTKIDEAKETASKLLTQVVRDYHVASISDFDMLSAFANDSRVTYALLTDDCGELQTLFYEAAFDAIGYRYERLRLIEDACHELTIDFFKKLVKDVLYTNMQIEAMTKSVNNLLEQIEEL